MDDIPGQVIVLILFVVISGIQWLIKKVQGKDQQHNIPESLENIYDEFREEIRQRQTTIQQPPPPPLPISDTPAPVPARTETTSYQQPEAPRFRAPEPSATLTSVQKEAAERFEELGRKKTRSSKSSHRISARALLTSPQSARQAVILQEIFAKPRSLQKF